VRSIIEDADGNFWFNSAYKYDVYGNSKKPEGSFYNRLTSIGNIDGRPDSDFWEYLSIAKDKNNELWIATYLNGVWHYDGTKTKHYPVQHNGEDISVFSIYTDSKGQLWLGTHEHGAYNFDGTTFQKFKP
jgi:ligand-binding sensor domain-containing protein